jgi:anthranilate synthase component 2/para-aminobenzoate synthetase component 2
VILVIDNYDSFTYNLVQALGELGAEMQVFRNDTITVEEADRLGPERLLISPGPGTPLDAGVSCEMIRHFTGRIPVLGVCLGHQCLAHAYGGAVKRAELPVHGKTALVEHDEKGVLRGLQRPFEATRYHSLIVEEETLPAAFEPTSWTVDDHLLMGLRHREHPVEGVQFHPESFLTVEGQKLLRNFLQA